MDNPTNSAPVRETAINITDLITTPELGHRAAVLGIIAFENDVCASGGFPFKYGILANTVYRIRDAEDGVGNCLALTNLAQPSQVMFSIYVAHFNAADDSHNFMTFKAASYANPAHGYIDIDNYPAEREAIVGLLTTLQKNVDGYAEKITRTFLNAVYVSEADINNANQNFIDSGSETRITIIDIPSRLVDSDKSKTSSNTPEEDELLYELGYVSIPVDQI